jgi:predicted phage terminase large subunit-like protein
MAGPSHDPMRAAEGSPCRSLFEWVNAVQRPDQAPAAHHRLLLEELSAISRGDSDRLMVLMPPGSAKSTYGSVLFPPFWFVEHPQSAVIATSHTASLAHRFSRMVRDLVAEHEDLLGFGLARGVRAAGQWRTTQRGEYFAIGVRGSVIGRRADLIIIDDPISGQADVDSAMQRDRLWNWYRSELATRLKPKGRIVLIMCRWHQDDLVARLLAQNRDEWRVISLPALAGADDPLGRSEGAPLWPEWQDAASLQRHRGTVGEWAWKAQYQQSPEHTGGRLFDIKRIDIVDGPPVVIGKVVRAWDLAATDADEGNDPDWTVGVKMAREKSGRFVVLDVVRVRRNPAGVEDTIAEAARIDGTSVVIGLPQDPGGAGKHHVGYLARALAGFHVESSPETGAKETRAQPLASQVGHHNVLMVRANWNHLLLEELGDFPGGRKDDQVDAMCRAFRMLSEGGVPPRLVPGSIFLR